MRYECQSCYSKFDENEVAENSLGDPHCPNCGSFSIGELEEQELEVDDSEESFYDGEGVIEE
jgi:hypothetical protein